MSSEPAPAPANPVPKNTIDAGMYLGFGCLIISAVVLIISGLIFFSGYRMLQYNADPATRLRVAKNILATEALPEGEWQMVQYDRSNLPMPYPTYHAGLQGIGKYFWFEKRTAVGTDGANYLVRLLQDVYE